MQRLFPAIFKPVLFLGVIILAAGCRPSIAQEPTGNTETLNLVDNISPFRTVGHIEDIFIYSLWDELGHHELDKKLRACAVENPGGVGISSCLANALSSWNEEVNEWSDLIGSQLLRGKSAKAFNNTQATWESFKQNEFQFIEAKYEGMEGTMYPRRIIQEKLVVVRHRGLELYAYQQMLNVDR